MLATPSAFLASAASTASLQEAILPDTFRSLTDAAVTSRLQVPTLVAGGRLTGPCRRTTLSTTDLGRTHGEQGSRQSPVGAETGIDKARLLAATSLHAGDWDSSPSPVLELQIR
jgi:hypothetical protein